MKTGFYSISWTDIKISLRDLAAIMQMMSIVMLVPILATLVYTEDTTRHGRLQEAMAFIIPSVIIYALYKLLKKFKAELPSKTKHIMITVALTWAIIAVVGSLPFIIRGVLNPLDSLFESMSGWTTTGYSMIEDIENADRDILFYRGFMQGVGGLGVISLGMMLMLQGGSPGVGYVDVGVQKIKPGIKHTIREAWKIYALYILVGIVLLNIAGMNMFDAVNHSFAAMATGGFSTHADIGYYDSFPIELVLMLLMLLGMTSFIVHYRLFNGAYSALKGDEVKYWAAIIIVAISVISASFWGRPIPGVDTTSVFDVLRKTSFYVISGMSTCGFNTADYGQWPDFAKTFMIGLMYVGGMNSSTAGGIRVIRFVILLKVVHYSLKKLVLPKSALLLIKVDGKPLHEDIVAVIGYSAIYMLICIILAMVLMLLGYASVDSVSTIMSAMGNDGLSVLSGPVWYGMPDLGKMTIILAMWIGRIEIYPGLLILRNILSKLSMR